MISLFTNKFTHESISIENPIENKEIIVSLNWHQIYLYANKVNFSDRKIIFFLFLIVVVVVVVVPLCWW